MSSLQLRHPEHQHDLVLQQLSEKCAITCDSCGLDLHGPAESYCCQDCGFFIHKPCIATPAQLRHPAHPHELTLQSSSRRLGNRCFGCSNPNVAGFYTCGHNCNFQLDVACAISTLLPTELDDNKENLHQHLDHEHPFSSFDVKLPTRIDCRVCQRQISGQVYGCSSCIFLIHESCAELLQEAEIRLGLHPEHPLKLLSSKERKFQCDCCYKSSQIAYGCEKCSVYLNVFCAHSISKLPPPQEQEQDGIGLLDCRYHFHGLRYLDIPKQNDTMRCSGCRKTLSGRTYCCLKCCFFLHEKCAKLPFSQIAHYLHPGYKHSLRLQYNSRFRCSYCSCDCSGFAYGCVKCDYIMELECLIQTLSASKKNQAGAITPSVHKHKMEIVYKNYPGMTCIACRKPCRGLIYRCLTDDCGAVLDTACAELQSEQQQHHHPPYLYRLESSDDKSEETICTACMNRCRGHIYTCIIPDCPVVLHSVTCAYRKSETQHINHPPHRLFLLPEAINGSFICRACGETRDGPCYFCPECQFHMEIACASQEPTLKHPRHEHKLTYFQRGNGKNLRCNVCGKGCAADLYRCVPCDFNLHHHCLPLESTIKLENHIHDLVLKDKIVDEKMEEHYCDRCEKPRHPEHGVYHCEHEKCTFSAHIDCEIHSAELEKVKGAQKYDGENFKTESKIMKNDDDETVKKKSEIAKNDGETAKIESEIVKYDGEISIVEAEIVMAQRNLSALQEKMDLLQKSRAEKVGQLYELRPLEERADWSLDCPYCSGEVYHRGTGDCPIQSRNEEYKAACIVYNADKVLQMYGHE